MKDSKILNGDNMGVGKYDDYDYLGKDQELYHWTAIGDDYVVPGPPMNDHYNERYGLKQRFS